MTEFTSTRSNPGIDPHFHAWGWEVPVYLFLGGLVAGLMILSGYHILRAQWDRDRDHGHYVSAPLLSLVLLSLGMGALFMDLEYKLHVWRLYLTFEATSPMSWGSWILMLVYPTLLGSFLVSLPETMPFLVRWFPKLNGLVAWVRRPRVLQTIGFANVGLGIGLGIYTGILLSALGARPLWSSALLGPLFLFSGLSTGAATLHLLAEITGKNKDDSGFSDAVMSMMVHWLRPRNEVNASAHKLTHADNSFLTVELSILILFLVGMVSSTEVHQRAADLLLTGPYAASFWVFVIGIGILLPLFLQLLQAMNRIKHTMIPALLVVVGGLVLRFVLVFAGQASHWAPTIAGHAL